MKRDELILTAFEARKQAYAPYSRHKVGAALLAENGKVYTGCNIENIAYGPTNCAERTAFLKQSAKGNENLAQLLLLGDMRRLKSWIIFRHVESAGR